MTSPSPCILSKVRTRCGLLTSFKSSNSWWFAGPHARPPHRSTLRKRHGDGFDSERTIFHSKCLLTSFKNLNSWWFAGPQARPPRRATLRKRPGNGFYSEKTIFDSKWSQKPSPELPRCLRKTSADLPLAHPETHAAPGRSSARGSLTSP